MNQNMLKPWSSRSHSNAETHPVIPLGLGLEPPWNKPPNGTMTLFQSVNKIRMRNSRRERLYRETKLNFKSSSWYKLWSFPYLFWQKLSRWQHTSTRKWLHQFFLKSKLINGLQNKALKTPWYQYFQLLQEVN